MLVFTFGATLFMYEYGILQQGFVKSTGLSLKENSTEVQMVNHYHPSLSFYAEKDFSINTKPETGGLFLVKNGQFPPFKNEEILRSGSGLKLVKIEKTIPVSN